MIDTFKRFAGDIALKNENKALREQNARLLRNFENIQASLRAATPICSSCHVEPAQKVGGWCETCKVNFAYGV